MTVLRSRDNPRVKHWARLAADGRYRKKERRALIEGPRLVAALLDRGLRPLALLVTEDALRNAEIKALVQRTKLEPVELATRLFDSIADADTPQGIAAEIEIPAAAAAPGDCVFLEGIQDAGNVGAVLDAGARRIVVVRAITEASDPEGAARTLRAALDAATEARVGAA